MGIVQFLVEQSGNPSGFIGELLLNTMDMAHGNAIRKALEPIHHDRGYSVLDIGCGSGYALRIMNSRFHDSQDLVTAFQTHYFRPDIHQACREIQRVLKPNGLFILSGDLYKIKYHLVGKYQFMEEYPELLKEEGFSEIKIFPYNGFMIAHSKK